MQSCYQVQPRRLITVRRCCLMSRVGQAADISSTAGPEKLATGTFAVPLRPDKNDRRTPSQLNGRYPPWSEPGFYSFPPQSIVFLCLVDCYSGSQGSSQYVFFAGYQREYDLSPSARTRRQPPTTNHRDDTLNRRGGREKKHYNASNMVE